MSNDFGKYLKHLRDSRGMTVNQLGMYSGMSGATISRIENGKRKPPKPENMRKIASALKHPYEDLMKAAGYLEEEGERGENKPSAEYITERVIKEWVKEFDLDLSNEEDKERLETIIRLFNDSYNRNK